MRTRWDFGTTEEIKDMYEMFENGLKTKEIEELTGAPKQTIYNRKSRWKKEKKANAEVSKTSEEKTEETVKEEISDYAKSYLAGDPAVIRSDFEIRRSIQIRSKKTGILYEMEKGDKKLKITLNEETQINIELDLFEKFVDEGIDVYLEMTRKTA